MLLLFQGARTFAQFLVETPTPTRFLKGLDDSLMPEINRNPFDDAFSRAINESKAPTTPTSDVPVRTVFLHDLSPK